jgi:hypothetical protein
MLPALVGAQEDFTPVYQPSLHIARAAGEIRIDGWLNDAGWQTAAEAVNFVENSPGDQIKPPVATRAMMSYDDEYLYVAIVAEADPDQVRASLCERDRTPGDDNLGVYIDTYGDAAWAYSFYVNAHGIQYDALWSADYGNDTKYDLIWEAAGKKTAEGFQVEMAIPFASLRFPNEDKQTWRVQFHRYHEREVSYQMTWGAEDREESCWPCQWGTVTGIENVRPGRGIEVIPSFVGFQSGSEVRSARYLETDSVPYQIGDSLSFSNEDFDGDVSFSGKYAMSSNATAEITVNPDFSQVEADANQIDVNTTTALWFPEKRPFFQEGSDLFNTRFDVVYTRFINDPDVAAKLTYRKGRTSIAYLGAHDAASPIIIPFAQHSSPTILAGNSFSNIFRVRQTFGANSRVGFLATDRRLDGGGGGSTIGLDGTLRISKGASVHWQATATHTQEPDDSSLTPEPYQSYLFDGEHTAAFDGESFWGHGLLVDFDYDGGDYFITSAYLEKSPTFRTDNGFERTNDEKFADLFGQYTFRFDEGLFRTITPDFHTFRTWYSDNRLKEEQIALNLSLNYRWWQASNHNQYWFGNENYAGTMYEGLWGAHHCFHFNPSHVVGFGGSINYGHKIARWDREVGSERYYSAWIDLKPLDRFLWENSYSTSASTSVNTGTELYEAYIFRSKVTYHFNRKLWFRFVAQYHDGRQTWDFDPLLTYQINPFTVFYVGTTFDYRTYDNLNSPGNCVVDDGGIDACYSHTKLTSRQFFVKLQYLFQL